MDSFTPFEDQIKTDIAKDCAVDAAVLNADHTVLTLIHNNHVLAELKAGDFNVADQTEFLIALLHISLNAKMRYYATLPAFRTPYSPANIA